MAVPKKRIRGRRARLKQRPRGHDLRSQYREGDLSALADTGHLAVMTFEDPYGPAGRVMPDGNLDVTAKLEPARHADGTIAEGAPGWTPPRRPLVTVVSNMKEDPLGRMFARRQIDQSQFAAGREYQQAYDLAVIGRIRSVDLTRTKVSGGLPPDPLPDYQRWAAVKLRSIEASVQRRYGEIGVSLCRAVLGDRRPIEQVGRAGGVSSLRDLRSWCWLFRKVLEQLALALGFVTSLRRLGRLVVEPDDPADDPARHADAAEFADLRLRCGRPNNG